ncbi:MAG: methylated-DNA--[protein]-cysteine S-methyltransferase [Paucibacter sp.]|nr:methylated-DNA--[protein]-cysteine S-methyltransferase [Roseateles sp.]
MNTFFACYDTALGTCAIAWNAGGRVIGSQLPEATPGETRDRMRSRFPAAREIDDMPPPVIEAVEGVRRLLAGQTHDERELLMVDLDDSHLPDFNRRVLALTRRIPVGHTLTYGEVASRLGEPGAARAVGQAEGHNPFAPIVPCHRVMGVGGAGTGFSAHGGVDTKMRLLAIEARAAGQLVGEQNPLF